MKPLVFFRLPALGVVSALLAACGGHSGSTPSGPNPPSTNITVYSVGTTVDPGVTVTASTALSNFTMPSGTIITSGVTDATTGQVRLSGLPASGTICISATKGTSPVYAAGYCVAQPFPANAVLYLGG